MEVRRFSAGSKVKLPGGHLDVHGVLIQVDARRFPAGRVVPEPIRLDVPLQIEAM